MKSFPKSLGFVLLAVLLASSFVIAEDIPLANWTVPPYHASSARGGITTMGDITPGVPFVGVAPCRLVDTRQAGFPATYGMPALGAGVPRNFDLNNDPLCTGLPTDAAIQAYSLNFTVTNVQGPGFLKVFPQGGSIPADISTLNYIPGQNIANAAIVPAGTGGGITVISGVSGTDLIIDINGYFSVEPGALGNAFEWDSANTGTFGTGIFSNVNTGTARTFGLVARANSTGDGTAALQAQSFGATGFTFGVKGITSSSSNDSAGVKGVGGGGDPLGDTVDCGPCFRAGVRGVDAIGNGVQAIGKGYAALSASYLNGSNVDTTVVHLGWTTTTAIQATGDISKSGSVSFIEPHPTDASKEIVYASLEGPEAGTYFRGRAKFQNGTATIEVPETFRIVTDPEGLSIQVTPIGAMATVAVMQLGLDRIVVNGSRNVEFFYTVNGVRRAERNFQPIRDNAKDFVPIKADAAIPAVYGEEFRKRLIANGTYKPDGTVNTETAQRLGWDRIWEARVRPQPQPASDSP